MEDVEGPIPLDDGPVEDEVLEDFEGDDVGLAFFFNFLPDSATKGQTGLTFANATRRDIHIKVTVSPKIRFSLALPNQT